MYVVGGYNGYLSHGTLTDMWALNLLTREWSKVKLSRPFPDTMASFSCELQ